jgi:hypothetical protein
MNALSSIRSLLLAKCNFHVAFDVASGNFAAGNRFSKRWRAGGFCQCVSIRDSEGTGGLEHLGSRNSPDERQIKIERSVYDHGRRPRARHRRKALMSLGAPIKAKTTRHRHGKAGVRQFWRVPPASQVPCQRQRGQNAARQCEELESKIGPKSPITTNAAQ